MLFPTVYPVLALVTYPITRPSRRTGSLPRTAAAGSSKTMQRSRDDGPRSRIFSRAYLPTKSPFPSRTARSPDANATQRARQVGHLDGSVAREMPSEPCFVESSNRGAGDHHEAVPGEPADREVGLDPGAVVEQRAICRPAHRRVDVVGRK